ncbi:hypothetical protein BLA29_014526 [Euroglyphus maynei]|uniref:Uncharacterized protein n=1 Tax=Euroglyphus maynei TaxID=6958 RepID=A0A1Y3ANM7_EURMA|nr:hypothetical protein BLA29_014526 [Euroglyphus maynei]
MLPDMAVVVVMEIPFLVAAEEAIMVVVLVAEVAVVPYSQFPDSVVALLQRLYNLRIRWKFAMSMYQWNYHSHRLSKSKQVIYHLPFISNRHPVL